jgi:hypothetical protein
VSEKEMKKPRLGRGKKHDAILESLEGLKSADEKQGTIELLKEDISLKLESKPYADI